MFFTKVKEKIQKTSSKITMGRFCIIAAIVTIIILVPVFMIAKYNIPSADDFFYGRRTREIYLETGSFFLTIKVAWEVVVKTWLDWQGTYSSIFFMALNPAIYSDNLYMLVPYILIIFLYMGVLLICNSVFGKLYNIKKSYIFLVSFFLIFFCVQSVPSPVEGFFWYNGSVHYTFMFSMELLLFSTVIAQIKLAENHKIISIILLLIACVLSAIVAGANLITALNCFVIYALFFVLLLANKNKTWLKVLPSFIIFLIGFAFNVFAPGNALRQQQVAIEPSLFGALKFSFVYATRYISEWVTMPFFIALLFLTPFLWKMAIQSSRSFNLPGLITLGSFCFFASCFYPTAYSLNLEGPMRAVNIYYHTFVLLMVFNIFYWLGYINCIVNKNCENQEKENWTVKLNLFFKKNFLFAAVCFFAAFAFSSYYIGSYLTATTPCSVYSLISGEAKEYYECWEERMELVKNPDLTDLEFKELTAKPYVLFFDDVTTNVKNWRNTCFANYYGKNSVIIVEDNN